MREHGVRRRALLVYSAAAAKLRSSPAVIEPATLQQTATLFHAFGEEYNERKLEEAHIFPAVKRAGGPAAGLPDILIAQHQRGREITDYILAVTQGTTIGTGNAEALAQTLDSFVLMYRHLLRRLCHVVATTALHLGAIFLSAGIQKFLFPDELGVGRFVKIGIPAPSVMAPFVGVCEIVCGVLILLGLLTRVETLLCRP
jgi:hypothetical protein